MRVFSKLGCLFSNLMGLFSDIEHILTLFPLLFSNLAYLFTFRQKAANFARTC